MTDSFETRSAAPAEAPISVVVPVFENESTIAELHRRVCASLGGRLGQMVFVDDASPDGSRAAIDAVAEADRRVERLSLVRNGGQHRAVLHGMGRARGRWTVVMDADLQDPAEAIPALIERAGSTGADVVFAGRRGRYEAPLRLLTSRLFKWLLALGCGVPPDAGMFFVCNRSAIERVTALAGPPPFVVAMIGRAGLRIDSLPVSRSRRPAGRSSYGSTARLRSAARGLVWAFRRRPALSPPERALHNARQRRYYAHPEQKAHMVPRRSRYLERHIDELSARADLRRGERVLEVGCGMGRYTLPLAERGLRVEAIDLSAELLRRLRDQARARGIVLHEGDVLDPAPALERGFDAVIGFFILHHLHDMPASLEAMARLLRPGGRLAFVEPNPYNPLYYVQVAIKPSMTWEGDRGITGMRRRPWLDAVARAGLADASFERFGFLPPQIAELPGAASVERRLERVSPLGPTLPFQILTARQRLAAVEGGRASARASSRQSSKPGAASHTLSMPSAPQRTSKWWS